MRENAYALFRQSAETYEESLGHLTACVNAISQAPLYSSELQDKLENGEVFTTENSLRMRQSTVTLGSSLHKYVVLLYDLKGSIKFSDSTTFSSHILKRITPELLSIANAYNGKIAYIPLQDETGEFCFFVARLIHSTTTIQPIGYTVIAVPTEAIIQLQVEAAHVKPEVVLLNRDGEILYSSDPGSSIAEECLSMAGQAEGDLETKDAYAYFKSESRKNYSVLLYVEKKDVLSDYLRAQKLSVLLVLLMAALTAGIVILIAGGLTHPLRKITRLMQEVQKGDLNVRFHSRYTDEVGILGNNFNYMLENLQEQIRLVTKAEQEKQKMVVDVLKQQINPHFVYNTLETFRMMAIEREDWELSELIACFGKIMRYNITYPDEETTIEKEVEYLNYYLRIQNLRYDNRILLDTHIDPEVEGMCLIKLLLQPLVENSILHGISMDEKEPVHIDIYARPSKEDRDYCVIIITDDGKGMTAEAQNRIMELTRGAYLESRDVKAVGLKNVSERIRLYYGIEDGLSITSEQGKGTVVRLLIPLHRARTEIPENDSNSSSGR